METQKPQSPRTIFELINQNIVDMSKDIVALYDKVEAIYNVLFPIPEQAEPNADGAVENNE